MCGGLSVSQGVSWVCSVITAPPRRASASDPACPGSHPLPSQSVPLTDLSPDLLPAQAIELGLSGCPLLRNRRLTECHQPSRARRWGAQLVRAVPDPDPRCGHRMELQVWALSVRIPA